MLNGGQGENQFIRVSPFLARVVFMRPSVFHTNSACGVWGIFWLEKFYLTQGRIIVSCLEKFTFDFFALFSPQSPTWRHRPKATLRLDERYQSCRKHMIFQSIFHIPDSDSDVLQFPCPSHEYFYFQVLSNGQLVKEKRASKRNHFSCESNNELCKSVPVFL